MFTYFNFFLLENILSQNKWTTTPKVIFFCYPKPIAFISPGENFCFKLLGLLFCFWFRELNKWVSRILLFLLLSNTGIFWTMQTKISSMVLVVYWDYSLIITSPKLSSKVWSIFIENMIKAHIIRYINIVHDFIVTIFFLFHYSYTTICSHFSKFAYWIFYVSIQCSPAVFLLI